MKKQIEKAAGGLIHIRDIESFGYYYEAKLKHRSSNLNKNWGTIKDRFKNPDLFIRRMDFYLLS